MFRVFALVFLPLVILTYVPIVETGSLAALGGHALPLLMWTPGVAAIIASLVSTRSLAPLGLRFRAPAARWTLAMILFPLAYTLAIYPTLAALGMVELGSRNLRLDYFVLGFFGSCLYALGEELGWRGLLAPAATRRFGFHRGQLLIGLVWFVYHLPALLFTGYGKSPYPVYGNAMFLVSVVGLSVLLGWVRHASQSVWPCVAYHGMHNLVFLHLFDPMERTSAAADRLIGEQGALLALVLAAAWAYAARAAARASLPAALPVTRRRDHTTPERRAT